MDPIRLRAFRTLELNDAYKFASEGGAALHLHNIIVNYQRAPKCFIRDVRAGKPIAHLFHADALVLNQLAKQLGVKVILIERPGQHGQHIDLCGAPLVKALALCENPEEAREIFASFADQNDSE